MAGRMLGAVGVAVREDQTCRQGGEVCDADDRQVDAAGDQRDHDGQREYAQFGELKTHRREVAIGEEAVAIQEAHRKEDGQRHEQQPQEAALRESGEPRSWRFRRQCLGVVCQHNPTP